jgi:hypothetical protein
MKEKKYNAVSRTVCIKPNRDFVVVAVVCCVVLVVLLLLLHKIHAEI